MQQMPSNQSPAVMSRGHVMCVMALLLLLLATCPVTSQIHFSPTWGTGKRSDRGSAAQPLPDATSDSCWAQSDLRIVFQLAQMIKREAERFNQCMQADDSMAAFNNK